jgi:hypothetical protein
MIFWLLHDICITVITVLIYRIIKDKNRVDK